MKIYENLDIADINGDEVWVDIKGFKGYQISNYGRVKLLRPFGGSYIKMLAIKSNYSYVRISKNNRSKGYRICRLVAIHFVPNKENKPFVNHIDGNKKNDIWYNLEWVTASENMLHAYKKGLKLPTREQYRAR